MATRCFIVRAIHPLCQSMSMELTVRLNLQIRIGSALDSVASSAAVSPASSFSASLLNSLRSPAILIVAKRAGYISIESVGLYSYWLGRQWRTSAQPILWIALLGSSTAAVNECVSDNSFSRAPSSS